MTLDERAGKLRVARYIVEEVLADLDVHEVTCGACNHKVYDNWDDAQAKEQLTGVTNKLNKWATIFEFGKRT